MRIWIYAIPLMAIAAIIGGISLMMTDSEAPVARSAAPETVLLLCDESIHPPVAGIEVEHGGGIIELFLRRSGVRVEVDYDTSAELLEAIRREAHADLFLPGDELFLDLAREDGLVEEVFEIASLVPVILVPRGNPDGIEHVADLAAPQLRLAIVDRDASAIGRVTHELLERHEVLLADHGPLVTPPGPTAVDLARSVQAGEADAAIVWKPVATQFPRNTQYVDIPAEENVLAPLYLALLTTGSHPENARRFAEFISGPVGQELFQKYHYHVELDEEY